MSDRLSGTGSGDVSDWYPRAMNVITSLATSGANSQDGVSAPIWLIVVAVAAIVIIGVVMIARRKR